MYQAWDGLSEYVVLGHWNFCQLPSVVRNETAQEMRVGPSVLWGPGGEILPGYSTALKSSDSSIWQDTSDFLILDCYWFRCDNWPHKWWCFPWFKLHFQIKSGKRFKCRDDVLISSFWDGFFSVWTMSMAKRLTITVIGIPILALAIYSPGNNGIAVVLQRTRGFMKISWDTNSEVPARKHNEKTHLDSCNLNPALIAIGIAWY